MTPDRVLERWHAAGRRGALVGPHGTGKTTLLGELGRRLESTGRTVVCARLRADASSGRSAALATAISSCDREGVLCVDGFDLLSRSERGWLAWRTRRIYGVLVTSHARCAHPTLHETRTSPALLAELTAELLAAAGDASSHALIHPRLEGLHAACNGNLRDAMFALYHAFANDRPPWRHTLP